jgi:hypothetical protein
MVPSICSFEADIRLSIGMKARMVRAYIDDILVSWPGISYRVQQAASNPPSFSALDHPFLNCIADVIESVTGRRPTPLVGLGGTDFKIYRYHNILVFIFGPSPSAMGAKKEALLIDVHITVIKTHKPAIFDIFGIIKSSGVMIPSVDVGFHALGRGTSCYRFEMWSPITVGYEFKSRAVERSGAGSCRCTSGREETTCLLRVLTDCMDTNNAQAKCAWKALLTRRIAEVC